MPRRCHRTAPSLSVLVDREIARAYRRVGLAPPTPKPAPRPRPKPARHLELVPSPAPAPSPNKWSPEQEAHFRKFPTLPAWFANLEPEDLVPDLDTSNFPCMADAEDGEQPWDDTRLDEHGERIAGSLAFPFVGPPDDLLAE